MNRNFLRACACLLPALIHLTPNVLMAQTNQTDARRWLTRAEVVPPFATPRSKAAWEVKRKRIRTELLELLGKWPSRPRVPKVETLSREDRGDYIVEKFQFDNGAGSTVPGYVLLPKNVSGKAPAILYCH